MEGQVQLVPLEMMVEQVPQGSLVQLVELVEQDSLACQVKLVPLDLPEQLGQLAALEQQGLLERLEE